jgi:hypothetical protein
MKELKQVHDEDEIVERRQKSWQMQDSTIKIIYFEVVLLIYSFVR